MKKTVLVLLLLFGITSYSQEYELEIKQLEKELKKELNKEYTKIDTLLVKNLRAKIRKLNDKLSSPESVTNKNVDITRTNNYEIVYDFKTGKSLENSLQLKVNTPTILKVININRLAYDISISSKDTLLAETFMTDEPVDDGMKAFSKIKESVTISTSNGVITDPQKLDISSLNKEQDFIKNGDGTMKTTIYKDLTEISKINQYQQEKLNYKKQLDSLQLELNVVNANTITNKSELENKQNLIKNHNARLNLVNQSLNNASSSLTPDYKLSLDNEKKNIIKNIEDDEKQQKILEIDLSVLQIKIGELNNTIKETKSLIKGKDEDIKKISDNFQQTVKKYNEDNLALQEAFYKLNTAYQSILKLTDNYLKIKTVTDYPYMNKDKYLKEHQKKLVTDASKILQQSDIAIHFKDYYNQLGIKYSNLKYNPYLSEYLNYGGQTKLFAQGDYIKELADKIYKDVANIKIEVLFQKIQHLLQLLENENTYNYVSAPIQPTQDAAVFEIKITKKGDNNSDVTDEKSFKHTEFTYGGTRIDFSLGLAASYFSNTDVYEFGIQRDTITNVDNTTIAKRDSDLVVPSMVGLVTMSFRRTQYLAYGGSAGLGIDVVNGKIQLSNFFIGPTILLGKYDRIFITAGASFRNVGQLKSGYEVDQVLTSGKDDINNFITEKYKVGGFIGFTYNLTKGVRANYKRIKK